METLFFFKMYVALIDWRFISLLKHIRILVKGRLDYFSLSFRQPEARKLVDTQKPSWSSAPFVEDSMSIDRDYFSLSFSLNRGKWARWRAETNMVICTSLSKTQCLLTDTTLVSIFVIQRQVSLMTHLRLL